MNKTLAVLAPLTVAAAVALGACAADPATAEATGTPSGAADAAQPPAGSFNQADVAFVAAMVPRVRLTPRNRWGRRA